MKEKTTLLLNWDANPYHMPIYIAQMEGYYEDENLQLAILEPSNPSDVTQLVGVGKVDIALKAMVHCYAARSRGYPVVSVGTLFNEPPTGLIFPKSSAITAFEDIRGKRLGFVGEFGKVMIDDLARRAGIKEDEYETVRVGMNIVDAIARDVCDAGIGLGCYQLVELEERVGESGMLRIDQLAGLGCCCFCSILLIARESFIAANEETMRALLRGTRRAMDFALENPEIAYELLCRALPKLRTPTYQRIFVNCLPYFSRDLQNVPRDWEKVGRYASHLGIASEELNIQSHYTNEYVPLEGYADVAPLS